MIGYAVAVYPSKDFAREDSQGALVVSVIPDTPAYDAGFSEGCRILSVDGAPLRDIIDWRWLSAEEEIEVEYIDAEGDYGTVELWREAGEDWGFEFEGLVFDGVKQCRNACSFCFMHMLPDGLRQSLYLRDDDFRLSFLIGTFVTMTNLSSEDEERIIAQHISPLRVSLHAVDADVRRTLMGSHAPHGLAAIERLLAAGIEMHAQIVLVPEINDGDVLERTLDWAYDHSGILTVGIVPLGFTDHQSRFASSFNAPNDARSLIEEVAPWRDRAIRERGSAWVYPADEFYCNAFGKELFEYLPPSEYYADYDMYEDGVGIIRSSYDAWQAACREGLDSRLAEAIDRTGLSLLHVCGEAMRPYFSDLVSASALAGRLEPLYVENRFFGGNVTVTGLLTGEDIVAAVNDTVASRGCNASDLLLLPDVCLNDDGILLDDMTPERIAELTGMRVLVVPSSTKEFFEELLRLPAFLS